MRKEDKGVIIEMCIRDRYIPGSLVTVMPGTSKAGMWFMRNW